MVRSRARSARASSADPYGRSRRRDAMRQRDRPRMAPGAPISQLRHGLIAKRRRRNARHRLQAMKAECVGSRGLSRKASSEMLDRDARACPPIGFSLPLQVPARAEIRDPARVPVPKAAPRCADCPTIEMCSRQRRHWYTPGSSSPPARQLFVPSAAPRFAHPPGPPPSCRRLAVQRHHAASESASG